jgi:hypothetical protein
VLIKLPLAFSYDPFRLTNVGRHRLVAVVVPSTVVVVVVAAACGDVFNLKILFELSFFKNNYEIESKLESRRKIELREKD